MAQILLFSNFAALNNYLGLVLFPSFGALPLHYAQGLPDPAFDLVMSKKEAMQQLAVRCARRILVAFLSAAFANAILRRTKVERHQGLASRGALTLVRQALHFGKI